MTTLFEELTAAGYNVIYAYEDGRINLAPGEMLTPAQLIQVADIVLNHIDPTARALRARVRDRYSGAKATAETIPNWAIWTQAQLQAWWDANLSDAIIDALSIPAGAKAVLKAQSAAVLREGQLLIALRDQIWPDLPE